MSVRPRWLAASTGAETAATDPHEPLRMLAAACVPDSADACLIDLVEGSDTVRVAAAFADGAERSWTETPRRLRFEPGDARRRALASGRATVVSDDVAAALGGANGAAARDAGDAGDAGDGGAGDTALLGALAPVSALLVPIHGRHGVLGVITLLAQRPELAYGGADLDDAEELGAQAGLVLDNMRLVRRADAAARARSEFLAVVSHELRTPLNIILGYTELMLTGVPARIPERLTHQVERVRASARYLLQRIEEVLAYARLEGGHEPARTEPVDVRTLVRDVAELIEPLTSAKGLEFVVTEAPDIEITTDATHARQILLHLLTNAVRYTDAGRVELTTTAADAQVRFAVSDTGRGIGADQLAQIFEPFRQGDSLATRRTMGTGLGLSLARRLAELLGGEIDCRSEVGVGSTFTLTLGREP